MPILDFNEGDALQAVIVEPGIYLVDVTKIDGPKTSSTGKSQNFFIDFTITAEGKYKGKLLSIVLSSGTKTPSMLGLNQWFPQNTFLQIGAAIAGKRQPDIAKVRIDTDALLGQPLELAVGIHTENGQLLNIVNNFLPVGSNKNGPAF